MSASYGDILFFALVVVYLGFKLFSVLGRKNDEDNQIDPSKFVVSSLPNNIEKKELNMPKAVRIQEQPVQNNLDKFSFVDDSVKQNIKDIIAKDPSFSLDNFIEGAKIAFEMLLKAHSEGDKKTLKNLLSDGLYDHLEKDIDKLAQEKHISNKSLVAFEKIEIDRADISNNVITMGLKFLTEQISSLRDENGKVVEGDPKAIIVVEDNWVFERNVKSSSPNWTIVSL